MRVVVLSIAPRHFDRYKLCVLTRDARQVFHWPVPERLVLPQQATCESWWSLHGFGKQKEHALRVKAILQRSVLYWSQVEKTTIQGGELDKDMVHV